MTFAPGYRTGAADRVGRGYLRCLLDRRRCADLTVDGSTIVVGGRRVATFQEREPERLPRAELGVAL